MGTIDTALQFIDIRLQIATEEVEGYYIIFEDEKISINKYGVCEKWPKGLFDVEADQVYKLLKYC